MFWDKTFNEQEIVLLHGLNEFYPVPLFFVLMLCCLIRPQLIILPLHNAKTKTYLPPAQYIIHLILDVKVSTEINRACKASLEAEVSYGF